MTTKVDEKWVQPDTHLSNYRNMVSTQLLGKVVECALISPYITDEKPISLLIVAKPESGKSTVMKQYRENKGVIYLSDCTAYGITRDILPKIVSGEVKTIMIPDLLTPLSKQTKTRQSFVGFLNNLIEEGVAKITTYATVWNKEANANLITAVTEDALLDGRRNWAKMGFLSRFIIFSYSYSLNTVIQILDRYSEDGLSSGLVEIELPTESIDIDLPVEIADKINPVAMKMGKIFEIYGFRAKINFRSLLKALAYRNKRDTVTDQEYHEFLEIADYMNLDFNPLFGGVEK